MSRSALDDLPLVCRGKVRDVYRLDEARLLIVTTDRISAFDVVLPDPIPGKGEVLTELSRFWFDKTEEIVGNHLAGRSLEDVVGDAGRAVAGRSLVVRRCRPLPIEAIVRGYLAGSGWQEYRRTGAVCGIALPPGLQQAQQLPEPLFTPSTKAGEGQHDENIDFDRAAELVGKERARQVRELSLRLYREAAAYALERGIIIADTKLEFGLDDGDELILIDELFTPDSSRFWPLDEYRPGTSPPSFDKQFVRDYLESSGWNRSPPAPSLPASVIEGTAARYREARNKLID